MAQSTASTAAQAASEQALRAALRRRRPWWYGIVRFARKKPLGAIGGLVFLSLVTMAIVAPLISPYDPNEPHPIDRLTAPGSASRTGNIYALGTDYLGRDLLSRLIYGSRVSLYVGVFTVLIGTTLGSILGMTSGYVLGWFDLIAQRFVDGMLAFPGLVLALVIVTTLGPGLTNSIIAITVGVIVSESRIVRGYTLSIKQNMYVDAARAVGCSDFRIVLRHILPNVAAPIVILGSVLLAGSIIFEASLSFLGLGTQPPTPSWGRMLSTEGRVYMEAAPWLAILPGLVISSVVLGINFLGDAIRDYWDPRLRGAQ